MKYVANDFQYTFTPGAAGSGVLDFSPNVGFLVTNLFAVINISRVSASSNGLVYATGTSGFGADVDSTERILTLHADTSTMAADDILQFVMDGGDDDIGELLALARGLPSENPKIVSPQGLVTRPIMAEDILRQILTETKITNILLMQYLGSTPDSLDNLRASVNVDNR